MLARELAIVLRARVTWLQAALSALLVGHGFVLAIDLYSAGSRSALAGRLMSREFDPLLGLVRPTLGGLYLALSLLGPLVAARPLAVEKERRTFAALLLQTGAPVRLAVTKAAVALVGVALQLVGPMERGTLAFGACLWMVAMTLGALVLAWLGVRVDLGRPRRLAAAVLVLLATASGGALASRVRRGFDLTEDRRASLPPAAVQGLRTLPGPVAGEGGVARGHYPPPEV